MSSQEILSNNDLVTRDTLVEMIRRRTSRIQDIESAGLQRYRDSAGTDDLFRLSQVPHILEVIAEEEARHGAEGGEG